MGEYLAELNEQLEDLNDCLLQLEASTGDTTEITQKIFRLAHTIKGNAATMGFDEIAKVSHAFEDLLEQVQEGAVELGDEVIEGMLAAFDHIRARAASLDGESEFEEDPAPLVTRLRALMAGGAAPAAAPPPPAPVEDPPPKAGDPLDLANEIAAEMGGLPPGLDLEELARLTGSSVPTAPAPAAAAGGAGGPPSEPPPPPPEPVAESGGGGGGWDIDLSEYFDEYRIELEEQLEGMNDALLMLEANPADQERINELFRLSHTIKGAAATMGFEPVAKLSEAFEDVLEEIRSHRLACSPDVFQTLLNAFDGLTALAGTLPETNTAVDVPGLSKALRATLAGPPAREPPGTTPEALPATPRDPARANQAAETMAAATAGLAEPTPAGAGILPEPLDAEAAPGSGDLYKVTMRFSPDQEMRSVRAFLVLNHIQEVAELVQSRPTLQEVEDDQLKDTLEMVIRTKITRQEIDNILSFGEAQSTSVEPLGAGAPASLDQPAAAAPAAPAAPTAAPTAAPAPVAPTPPPPEPDAPVLTQAAPATAPPMPTVAEVRARLQAGQKPLAAPEAPRPRVTPDRSLLSELSEEMKATVVEYLNQDLNVLEVTVLLNDAGERSAARAMTITNYLKHNSHVIHQAPTEDGIRSQTQFQGAIQALVATDREVEQLRELALAEEVEKTTFTPIALDGLELVTTEEAAKRHNQRQEKAGRPSGKSAAAARLESKGNIPTVRVTVDRLDYLMNLVAELVISKTQLQQLVSQFDQGKDPEVLQTRMVEVNGRLSRITSDLQEGIMKARMVQIGQVFFRFTRLVRDLSKNLGKNVEFLIEGTETELDKTVIDEIGDPLMHLIRNSLDHGIESPEERVKRGKPAKGILLLKASHAGDHIVVETADDGRGMDPEKIRQSAVRKGVISEAESRKLSPSETFNLIFMPGFSTSKEITSVSGRGVGMDVVKTTVEGLGGEIQVKSEVNVGTSIQIKLPLTLAIIQGLLVSVGDECFSIPLSTVKETIQLQEGMIHNFNGFPAMVFRGEMITLIYLDEFFDLPRRPRRKRFIVFAGVDEERVGIVVDSLIGRREIVIKSLDKTFMDVRGFAGATVLGDGQVSLILDIPALIDETRKLRAVLPPLAS